MSSSASTRLGRVKAHDTESVASGDTTGDIIPANASTTYTVPMNDSVSAYISTGSDHDWFRVFLVAGHTYLFKMQSDQLIASAFSVDPYLVLRDPTGSYITYNDDYGTSHNSQLTYTAQQTGYYFLDASSYSAGQHGTYFLSATGDATLPTDSIGNDKGTASILAPGGSFQSTIDTTGDVDWYMFTPQAGYTYSFDLKSSGGSPLSNPVLSLMDGLGNLITLDDDGGGGHNSHISFTATDTTNWVYLVAGGIGTSNATGTYTLTASAGQAPTIDTIAGDASTTTTLAVGGSVSSNIDSSYDTDWLAVQLTVGQTYSFTMTTPDGSGLKDTFLTLFDNGEPIAIDDDGGPGLFSNLVFTAQHSGTYYLEASSFGDIGAYTVGMSTVTQPKPTASIDWGTKLTPSDGYVDIYFAPSGTTLDNVTSLGWTNFEIQQVMAAANTYSTFSNLKFRQTTSSAGADFKLVIANTIPSDEDQVLGYFYAPGETNAGIGVFARSAYGWGDQVETGLNPGGYGFMTLIHEIGHGLGLAHPQDNGGTSSIMMGVIAPWESYGLYDLNQGINTVMTYNDDWPLSPFDASGSYWNGHVATPMALDVAVIQAKYGARTDVNAGNSTYVLPVGASGNYQVIWDTGGTDTLAAASGASSAYIDLRAATLTYDEGGGGYLSYMSKGVGGFTIANGVIIENAVGSVFGDQIVGNATGNTLTGSRGNDIFVGGGGNDVIDGGAGDNIAVFSGRQSDYSISGSGSGPRTVTDLRGGSPDGTDQLYNIGRVQFSDSTVWIYNTLAASSDFNVDRASDLLFRSTVGDFASWQMNGLSVTSSGAMGNPGADKHFAGTGDLDGDGRADLLFQGTNGAVIAWEMTGASITGGGTIGNPGAEWVLIGVADFNGDSNADLLFRSKLSGNYATWDLNGTAVVGGGNLGTPGAAWTVKGIGDFNGDGQSDILFGNTAGVYATWQMNDATPSGGGNIGSPGASFSFQGLGDFNGDGRSDILFESASGQFAIWDMNATAIIGGGNIGTPGAAWSLAKIGDFNGDGKSDLMFRNVDGSYATWHLNDTSIIGGGGIGTAANGSSLAVAQHALDPVVLFFQRPDGSMTTWKVNGTVQGGGDIGNPGSFWTFKGTGDFNGDGNTGVVFQGTDGSVATWQVNGPVVGGGIVGNPGTDWALQASADFNGDGKTDLLFKNSAGVYATWDVGGTQIIGGGSIGTAAGYGFKAAADFNGDGKSDILFADDAGNFASWLLNDTSIIGGGTIGNPGADWTFKGTGDFNGDGKSDLLFQKTDGTFATWDLDGATIMGGGSIGTLSGGWSLADVADANRDGKSDLVMVNAAGSYFSWTMDDFRSTGGVNLGNPGAGWHLLG